MKKLFTLAAASLAATPALAHHPLGGLPMETFTHGVLSGVGHPVLGFDHLFFVLIVGVAALFTGHRYTAPAAYIVAMLIGCLMMSNGIGLPIKEAVIALSLLIVGSIVLMGRALGLGAALVIFAFFGLFHGSAFGDSIAGAESAISTTILIGYLIGLGVVQYVIAIAAGWAAERFLNATDAMATSARLAGAVVAGVGLFLTLEVVEGPVLAALFGI